MKNILKPKNINCIVFDFANTLCSDMYFQTHPTKCQNWRELFQEHIFKKHWLTEWCNGSVNSDQIAYLMKDHVKMPIDEILFEMKEGCKNLTFNKAVLDFALSQIKGQRKTALVTANIDLFSEVIIPHYQLNSIFNVVVNSADYHTDDKLQLWNIAFKLLGTEANFGSSLLIDDSEKWVNGFRQAGGTGFRYTNDRAFLDWLSINSFQ